ncbi:MAG TPA: helical backbone metal receptor, partial [Bacillota bacterium]|nr:helical backbone metal receptor [Bacillota bacterium]
MSRVRRIVSLVPSFTEIVYFLGLGGRLAGVTEHCDYPGEARTRAKVGTFGRPLPARILSLKPDLVLADAVLHRPWVTELRNAGLEVLARSLASVEDVFGVMDRIVQLCGVEDTGRERINSLREKVEQLRRAASRKRPRVFCLMRTDPVITPGPGSFQYDALEIAG